MKTLETGGDKMRPIWSGTTAMFIDVEFASLVQGIRSIESAPYEALETLVDKVQCFIDLQATGSIKYGEEVELKYSDYREPLNNKDFPGGAIEISDGHIAFILIDVGAWFGVDKIKVNRNILLMGLAPKEFNYSFEKTWMPGFVRRFAGNVTCKRVIGHEWYGVSLYLNGMKLTKNVSVDLGDFLGFFNIVKKAELPVDYERICEILAAGEKLISGNMLYRICKWDDLGDSLYLNLSDSLSAVHEDFRETCHALGQKCLWDIPLYLHNKRIPSTKRVLKDLGIE